MARRAHRDGTTTKRKDRWQAALWIDGTRVYRYTARGGTRADAERLLVELRRVRDANLDVAPDRLTLADYLRRWLEGLESPRRRRLAPKTLAHYRLIVDSHIIPALGHVTMARLSERMIQSWLDADPAAPRTVSHHRAVLRNALNGAVQRRILTHNPAIPVDVPTVPKVERPILTVEQAHTLLASIEGTALHAVCTLAMTTGMREGEILGLAWDDVDLKAGTLHVGWQIMRVEVGRDEDGNAIHDWRRPEPKKGSIATIPLANVTVQAFQRQRLRQAAARRDDWVFWGLVFTTADGNPIHANVLLKRFYAALDAAGLPRVHLHDLRHTAASILMAEGMDLEAIQKILRHRNSRMTAHYAHILPSLSRKAADAMDRALGLR